MHLAFALGLQDINNQGNLKKRSTFESKRMLKHLFSNLMKLLKTISSSASLHIQPSVVWTLVLAFLDGSKEGGLYTFLIRFKNV